MQKLKKYTSNFTPIKVYNHDWIKDYLTSILNLHKTMTDNPPTGEFNFEYLEWTTPYIRPIQDNYYYILHAMAMYCRVKVMWREKVERDGSGIEKVLWIMGSSLRIRIFHKMLTEWYTGIFNYEQWIRVEDTETYLETKFKTLNEYIKWVIQCKEDMVITILKKKTEMSYSYSLRLETHIKGRYHLDYKNYNTDQREYAHAISKRFHHRRMVL